MALFDITPDIQKLAEPVKEGWYPVVVNKISEKMSNSGSKMTNFSFKITGKQLDGDYDAKGNFGFYTVNHDYLQYSLDFLGVIGGVKQFDKQKGTKLWATLDEANKALKNKAFEVYIKPNEHEGTVSNRVEKIRNVGAGKAA